MPYLGTTHRLLKGTAISVEPVKVKFHFHTIKTAGTVVKCTFHLQRPICIYCPNHLHNHNDKKNVQLMDFLTTQHVHV